MSTHSSNNFRGEHHYKAAADRAYCERRDRHRSSWRHCCASFTPDPALAGDIENEFAAWIGDCA